MVGAPVDTAPAVTVAEGRDEVAALRGIWPTLRAEVPGPSSHLDWILCYADTLPPHERLWAVVVHAGGRPTGVAPLVRSEGRVARLRLSDDLGGFLATDTAQLERLVDAVLALRRPLTLDPLVADGATSMVVQQRARRHRHLVVLRERPMGPSLPLDRFADPWSAVTGKRGRALRKQLRAAEAEGDVRFDVRLPDELARWYGDLVDLEGAGWKGRAGTALATDPVQRRQLWRYITAPDVRPHVRFPTMHVDGRLAAIDMGVVTDGAYWGLKSAYDESLHPMSPGLLLKVHIMGWAARGGVSRFEFMGEHEPWKGGWGAPPRRMQHLRTYPANPAGLAALAADGAAKARRSLARAEHGSGGGAGT